MGRETRWKALADARRWVELEGACAAATARRASDATAWRWLGEARFRQELWGEAAEAFERAVALAPMDFEGWFRLGQAASGAGARDRACGAFAQVLALRPGMPEAMLGFALDTDDDARAEALLREVVSTKPEVGLAVEALAARLIRGQRSDEAEEILRELQNRRGEDPRVTLWLGRAIMSCGRHAEAAALLFTGTQRFPYEAQLWFDFADLTRTRFGAVVDGREAAEFAYRESDRLAPAGMKRLLARDCAHQVADWTQGDSDTAAVIAAVRRDEELGPFPLLAVPGPGRRDLQRAAWVYAKRWGPRPRVAPSARPSRRPGPVRVGYLSADFHNHATMFLIAGVLEHHDPARIEPYAYSVGPVIEDAMRHRARTALRFRECFGWSDEAIADAIVADEVDVLVDLKGHTFDGRVGVLALHPARRVVSWLGYPGTLGDQALADVIVGDPVVIPPALEDGYAERVVRMPVCYQPNDASRPRGAAPPRSGVGLPDGAFVFASFNQLYKLNATTFDSWMAVLRANPGSVLWMWVDNDVAKDNLRREAEARGVEQQRLIFAPRAAPYEHLARLQLADVILDTFPYTGHTTTSDALWMGVPVVTRMGDTFPSRVAASLLTAVGVPELATDTESAFVDTAVRLATDTAWREAIRDRIRRGRDEGPLFDTAAFARAWDDLLESIARED